MQYQKKTYSTNLTDAGSLTINLHCLEIWKVRCFLFLPACANIKFE